MSGRERCAIGRGRRGGGDRGRGRRLWRAPISRRDAEVGRDRVGVEVTVGEDSHGGDRYDEEDGEDADDRAEAANVS